MDGRKKPRAKQYNKGYRNEAIRMLLSFGGISGRGLALMKEDRRYYSELLMKMNKEGIVNKEPLTRMTRVYRLKDFEGRSGEYLRHVKMGYYGYYNRISKKTEADIGRTADKQKRTRAVRGVEASMMMYGAGIKSLWDEKEELEKDREAEGYYTIEELNEYGTTKLINAESKVVVELASRSIGALITPQKIYPVYHTGNKLLKWNDPSEARYLVFIRNIANSIGIDTIKNKANSCVVMGYDYSLAKRMMFPEDEAIPKGKISVNNKVYGNIYFIPYIREARGLLKRMESERYEEDLFSEIIGKKRSYTLSAADAVEDGVFHYNFCPSNISTFKSFLMQARAAGEAERYKVYCYDWQADFVRDVGGDDIAVIVHEKTSAEKNCANM